MLIPVRRLPVKILPDPKRVIARFFFNGEERSVRLIQEILKLEKHEVFNLISPVLQEYSKRHRNITKIFMRHCKKLRKLIENTGVDFKSLDYYVKLLIGSYFTNEYSIESAAFFNPSIVADPDQSDLEEGQLRLILSFRAVGEGHISSVVFRRALLDKNNSISVMPAGNYVSEAERIRNAAYNKRLFVAKAKEAGINEAFIGNVEHSLADEFGYEQLKYIIFEAKNEVKNDEILLHQYDLILALSDSYRELSFSRDTDISDRVIFPISDFEQKGIEDARFVRFVDDTGQVIYYATYTAYNGIKIMPKLLETIDFYDFKVSPFNGTGALNKNLALFPRKVNGRYVMLSRIDGWNNYLMYSDTINEWNDPVKIQVPKYTWELNQIGNCGSPIETTEGWLVITHGVGPMRRYCIGASLLDLDSPEVEIGRLKEPLLTPNSDEREGYVPNVVYSCGSVVNNDELIIPYGLSDYGSSFAAVNLADLLGRLKNG